MTDNGSRTQGRPRKRKKAPRIRASIRLETTKRIVIFSISALLIGSAQCSFFPIVNICPSTPDLIMGLILAVALLDNERSAMPLAIGAGFFIDAIGSGGFSLSPLLYFIYAAIIGVVSQKMMKSFPSFLLLLLPSLLYRALSSLLMLALSGGLSFSGGLIIKLLLEALCTFILCLPIYPIMKLATKPLLTHKKFTF